MFVGRAGEMAAIEERYGSGKFEFGIIYGRRRVGKTTLINEFIKNKRTVFFTAMETSEHENLVSLSRSILSLDRESLAAPVFQSFLAALEEVFALARSSRLVFVIDEYPFLAASYPGISSILQRLIDENKASSKLFMIINGSSMALMENYFFNYKRPLYGRKTFQLKIEPFGFFEMKDFFPKTSADVLPYIYGAFGGIPRYLEDYDEKLSFKKNIIKNYLQNGAPLLDEPESILKQEVRDPSNYNAIITAIAAGSTRYSEISGKAKLESGNISGFMSNLMSLNLVKKESPVIEGSRRSLYVISDNMIRFWYHFISANLSLIRNARAELAWAQIEPELDAYMGKVFEDIALQYLWRINAAPGKSALDKVAGKAELPFAFTDAGRWWGNDPIRKQEAEIDIIAHDGKKNAIFCECKWRKQKTGPEVLEELEAKAALPSFAQFTKKRLFLFSRSTFSPACQKMAEEMGNVRLIEYKEMG
ncbi:ATPase [Spirochaetia bacterium]|nr:ATPase [Spirochaetia bacterium]